MPETCVDAHRRGVLTPSGVALDNSEGRVHDLSQESELDIIQERVTEIPWLGAGLYCTIFKSTKFENGVDGARRP